MEFNSVQNRKKNYHHNHIPIHLKNEIEIIFSIQLIIIIMVLFYLFIQYYAVLIGKKIITIILFQSIWEEMEIHSVQNQKENNHNNHIPIHSKEGNGDPSFRVYRDWCPEINQLITPSQTDKQIKNHRCKIWPKTSVKYDLKPE